MTSRLRCPALGLGLLAVAAMSSCRTGRSGAQPLPPEAVMCERLAQEANGEYQAEVFFLADAAPTDPDDPRAALEAPIRQVLEAAGYRFLGWADQAWAGVELDKRTGRYWEKGGRRSCARLYFEIQRREESRLSAVGEYCVGPGLGRSFQFLCARDDNAPHGWALVVLNTSPRLLEQAE